MRAILAGWALCWEEHQLRRSIAMLEREQVYHQQLLAWHAERASAVGCTLRRLRRALSEHCLRAHVPSAHQLDGSRR